MIRRGLSVFDPTKELVDASGVTPKLSEGERVLWIGTPGWLSSFFCTTTVTTPTLLIVAFLEYRGMVALEAAHAIDRYAGTRWIVLCLTVFAAFLPQLCAEVIGGAFVYILTTKRMMVWFDRTRFFASLFFFARRVVDADGFASYDLKYLNGARVNAGLWSYGNVSVSYTVRVSGESRPNLSTYGDEPVFSRDRRYVKVFYRKLACIRVAEGCFNVYFGIKDVGRLGDVLNEQCAVRLTVRR
jgi:hypothetical protein